jgi:ferredoxin-NADP reductase
MALPDTPRAGRRGDGILFSQLRVGDRIELDGPYGMAYLREDSPRDIVCIAGGSGLSPMVSITRAAAVAPIDFVFGGRTAQDICGKEMLQMLPNLVQIFTTIQLFPACLKPMMAGMVTEAMCMKWRTVFSPHGFLRARSILQVPPQWDKQYRKCWSTSASTQPKCI